VETPDGSREAAVHRRGEAAARDAHEGAPRLQVQTQTKAQDFNEEGQVRVPDGVQPGRARGAEGERAPGRRARFSDEQRGESARVLQPGHGQPVLVLRPRVQTARALAAVLLRVSAGLSEHGHGLPRGARAHTLTHTPVTGEPGIHDAVHLLRVAARGAPAPARLYTAARAGQAGPGPVPAMSPRLRGKFEM